MASLDPVSTQFRDIVRRLLDSLKKGLLSSDSSLDIHPGSVIRMLTEAYAREMATFYAMLEQAHRSGYLATAEGEALDNVVELLGVRRARAGRLMGTVEFRRDTPAPEDIGIPSGWQVTGVDAEGTPLPLFETVEDAVLPRGEKRVEVPVQQVQGTDPEEQTAELIVNPGQLTLLPRPVLGVESVTNPDPLQRHGEDESDESLRGRARTALHDTAKGTLEAIRAAVVEKGVRLLTVREPPESPPGLVEVLISDAGFGDNPEAVQEVEDAVRRVKPAGVRVQLEFTRALYVQPEFKVDPVDPLLDAAGFARLRGELRQALVTFFQGLGVGESISRRRLESVLLAHPGVRNVSGLRLEGFFRQSTNKDGPELVRAVDSVMPPESQELKIGARQKALIDPALKPPLISRLRPPQYRLDMVVSRSAADLRPPELVRQALFAAVQGYAALLLEQQSPAIVWSSLEGELKVIAQVAGLRSLVVTHQDEGLAVTLSNAKDKDTHPTKDSPRLTLGSVEMVQV